MNTEPDKLKHPAPSSDKLYGEHTAQALQSEPISGRRVHPALIKAYGTVKKAVMVTLLKLGDLESGKARALITACEELMAGQLDDQFPLDALQGGAGTSTHMNVNEVLANRALQLLGLEPGEYEEIDPIRDVNRYQSTNDTYPAALHIAAIGMLRTLETELIELVAACQEHEQQWAGVVKTGRTELRDAVPTTMGRTFACFAEAFGRDRWRLKKAEERLRVVHLGGTAIGTGLGARRDYIFKVTDELKALTGYGLARAENMVDVTQNQDALVEVSGLLNTLAANLEKCANDIRWMSSGPSAGLNELQVPALQSGSSIMPGKLNPVIPEAVIQAAMQSSAACGTIQRAAAGGNFELNAFMPLLADSLLSQLDLMINAVHVLTNRGIRLMHVNVSACSNCFEHSIGAATVLAARIGYAEAETLITQAAENNCSIRDMALQRELLTPDEYDQWMSPESVMQLGYRPKT